GVGLRPMPSPPPQRSDVVPPPGPAQPVPPQEAPHSYAEREIGQLFEGKKIARIFHKDEKRIVWLDSDGEARYRGDIPDPILAEFQRLLTLSSIRLMNVYDSQVNQLLGEALAIALLDENPKHILKAFSGAREFIAKHDP